VAPTDPDVVVIGAGPNGLVAACALASAGFQVLVLEANPRRPGGALGTEQLTLPGFYHDTGPAFFPFGKNSPAFDSLNLRAYGVEWLHAAFESCHPAPDDSYACIARNPAATQHHFGSERDTQRWVELANWHARIEPHLLDALLLPFPSLGPLWRLGFVNALKLARLFCSSGRRLARRLFESEAAQRVLPSLALHVDVGPDDPMGAALGYVLGLTATTSGYGVPLGGARSITNALLTILERHGGRLRLGARVTRVIVRNRCACAVELAGGEQVRAERAIMANTAAPSLFLDLLERQDIPSRVARVMRRFAYGWGTFKLDWALSANVPWRVEAARQSAVVHIGDSVEELARFAKQVRARQLPERPYLLVGQQSLVDPSRAPIDHHTLYSYTHVPSNPEGGWSTHRERFADTVEARIEELAPGFRDSILARCISAPPELEAMDCNLVGGDLGGGSNGWRHQLLFRPIFPYFRYRTPVKRLYLCSSFAHPGAGVHGMCGYNAAQIALRDLG
jgi:phytoene dehydrogenase-like protein